MADRKITLKRNNAGTTEILYPTTTVDQIYSTDGTVAAFDSSSKLKYTFLPDGIVGGLKFQETRTAADLDSDLDIANTMDYLFTIYGIEGMVGAYYIISQNLSIDVAGNATQATNSTRYWQTLQFDQDNATGEEEPDDATTLELETGDWLIVQRVTGAGTLGDPYLVEFGVVNNTYQNATTSVKGVVELATNAETSTGTDTERVVTPAGLASVLANYVTTDNDTTYDISLGGADDSVTLNLNAGGSGSGTDSVTFNAGTNIALNLTGDTMEVSFTGVIPTINLNSTNTTSPTFYAPTASGTAGSASVSRQALFSAGSGSAPTWVDAPKVFYDDTTGWLHGDIVIDVDA